MHIIKESVLQEKSITKDKIIKVNQIGLHHNKDEYYSYYTPTLQIAYNLGKEGINLKNAKIVTGYRYGKAPETFISNNSITGKSENGLSLAALKGQKEISSSIWFSNRQKYYYSGLLVGKGSDNEPVILSFQAEDWD